eukprot:CAMPEP_0197037032 /NCGR_PEP_ID=MMETSP1384-20130603/14346_1 /TAXON_ID=29189 /ORGANISM="Ammonia sp." /LENGTH=242 /DNA_ID=CAMNT_0042467279 /DNA_START=85 /DNA_END=813 /DNA_ORIENTATION=+
MADETYQSCLKSPTRHRFPLQSDAELLKQAEFAMSIPPSFIPYLHVNSDGTPLSTEQDDVEMAVALSTLVSIIVDTCGDQRRNEHVLEHVVNEEVIGMMEHALGTVGSVAPHHEQAEIDCNLKSKSSEIRNTLQKLQKLQTLQTLQKFQIERVDVDHERPVKEPSVTSKASIASADAEHRYLCEFCGASFGRRASYARHRKQHLTAKPFECDVCLKRFSKRCRHKQHAVKAHGMHDTHGNIE